MNEAAKVETRQTSRGGDREVRQSLTRVAYEQIKHRIITCGYRPGEYLNEQKVCKDLGLGRTPVHQALNQLMHQGLVEVIPRKGVIVKALSLDEILNVAEIRLLCETECAALAAERARDKDLDALRQILKRAARAIPSRDIEQLMMLDRDFHCGLARASGNPVLAEILQTLHERSLRVWFISLNSPEHLKKVHSEHETILKALLGRDAKAARIAMRAHIQSYRQNISRSI